MADLLKKIEKSLIKKIKNFQYFDHNFLGAVIHEPCRIPFLQSSKNSTKKVNHGTHESKPLKSYGLYTENFCRKKTPQNDKDNFLTPLPCLEVGGCLPQPHHFLLKWDPTLKNPHGPRAHGPLNPWTLREKNLKSPSVTSQRNLWLLKGGFYIYKLDDIVSETEKNFDESYKKVNSISFKVFK